MVSAYREDTPPNGRQVTPTGAGQLLFNAANSIQKKCNQEGTGGGRVSARPQFEKIMKTTPQIETKTVDDIIAQGKAHTEKLRGLVKCDGEFVSLKWGSNWMHYEGNPMRNAEAFVNLLDHLIDKQWVTRDHLEALLCCYKGELSA